MHALEGTDSAYDKKAILAALAHLSRRLGPEPGRPPEVEQGVYHKGWGFLDGSPLFPPDRAWGINTAPAKILLIDLSRGS